MGEGLGRGGESRNKLEFQFARAIHFRIDISCDSSKNLHSKLHTNLAVNGISTPLLGKGERGVSKQPVLAVLPRERGTLCASQGGAGGGSAQPAQHQAFAAEACLQTRLAYHSNFHLYWKRNSPPPGPSLIKRGMKASQPKSLLQKHCSIAAEAAPTTAFPKKGRHNNRTISSFCRLSPPTQRSGWRSPIRCHTRRRS